MPEQDDDGHVKACLVFTALVVALSSGGCMWIEKETIEDLEQAVEDMETAIRRYHVEVLFPALAAATEAERKRYREILDNRDAQCDTEAPRFGRRGWDQCLTSTARPQPYSASSRSEATWRRLENPDRSASGHPYPKEVSSAPAYAGLPAHGTGSVALPDARAFGSNIEQAEFAQMSRPVSYGCMRLEPRVDRSIAGGDRGLTHAGVTRRQCPDSRDATAPWARACRCGSGDPQ